jgi:threonine/homoserine/homoserine lactone efflux protein
VFSAFLIASVILAVTPGPGVLYIVTRSLTLGSVFVAIAAVTDTAYATAAGALAPVMTRARGGRAVGRYLTGGSFIGLGIHTVARD